MNLGRGFLRVWIVFSILWIVGVGLVYKPMIDVPTRYLPGYVLPDDEKQAPDFIENSHPAYRFNEADVTDHRKQAQDVWLTGFPAGFKVFADIRLDQATFDRRLKDNLEFMRKRTGDWLEEKRKANVLEGLMSAFGFPLGLLVAGLVLRWILNGFRKTKAATLQGE